MEEERQSSFRKLVDDFVCDMKIAFPEYKPLIKRWYKGPNLTTDYAMTDYDNLFKVCRDIYKPHYKNILYKSDEIFSDKSLNTEFLPGISFAYIWSCNDLTENNREMIWNYLQMMSIAVVDVENEENSFQHKLNETIENLKDTFNNLNLKKDDESQDNEGIQENQEFNALKDDVFEGFLNTKLADIAKEIADDSLKNKKGNVENIFQDPSQLMNMVRTVTNKLDAKLKSGDVTQDELLAEASSMMSKIKNIPGLNDVVKKMQPGLKTAFKNANANKSKNDDLNEDDKMFNDAFEEIFKSSRF